MSQPVVDQLTSFFSEQQPDAHGLHLEGLDAIEFGHSAEMLQAAVVWSDGSGERRENVVVRIRPREPGLLEPYDMQRQFDVLQALADAPVKAPKALYIEPTGDVLGGHSSSWRACQEPCTSGRFHRRWQLSPDGSGACLRRWSSNWPRSIESTSNTSASTWATAATIWRGNWTTGRARSIASNADRSLRWSD